MDDFKLREELETSSRYVADLDLCQVRLSRDGDLDWMILIPKRSGKKDWSDLSLDDQYQLTREIDRVCKLMKETVSPDKLNVASLGNMVAQLHIHVISRYKKDRAWPGAIFGSSPVEDFDEERVNFWKSLFQDVD